MFAKNPRHPKCRFASQGSQMRGTDYIPIAVHAAIKLLLQKLIIVQLVKNFPDFFRKNGSFLEAVTKLRKAIINLVMSVCLSAWNNSAPTECASVLRYTYVACPVAFAGTGDLSL
jgi:hypothetical protein